MVVQSKEQDKVFLDKLEYMIKQVEQSYTSRFSYFLDPRQQVLAQRKLEKSGLKYCLWGGFEQAQRKMIGVFPELLEEVFMVGDSFEEAFPIVPVTFIFRTQDDLGHRDFLGSFMGLKIKRELVGDILVEPGTAVAFFTKVAAQLALTEVDKIGRVGVRTQEGRPPKLPKGFELVPIKGTVSSMRMDCVVAMVTGLSREKAAACIRCGEVSVNFFENMQISEILKEGDILSIRGWGRYSIFQIGAETKKGRVHLICNRFC